MKTQDIQKMIRTILVILVIAITEFAVTPAQAQNFHNRNYQRGGSSKPIISLTAGLGTRSFLIKSDIDYINNMKTTQQGWESSLMFGGNNVKARTGFGAFKTDMSDVNSIKQASIISLVNVYASTKSKFFRPYLITGIGVNIFTFTGSFVPKSPLLALLKPPACMCAPQPTGGLFPPPDPGSPEAKLTIQSEEPLPAEPEINTGKMTSTQFVSGLGGEISSRKNGRFLSMFGEMRYGLSIGTTTQTASMNETKIKNNLAFTFGIAYGLYDLQKVGRNSIR